MEFLERPHSFSSRCRATIAELAWAIQLSASVSFGDMVNDDLTVNGESTLNGSVMVNASDGQDFFIHLNGDYPLTSASGTNYRGQIYTARSEYNIPAGVTDSGYRIGLSVNGFIGSDDFAGHLSRQVGAWIRAGHYNHYSAGDPTGTIDNEYGLWIENLNSGSVTVANAYGLYQSSPHVKNYFAGELGIGTGNPSFNDVEYGGAKAALHVFEQGSVGSYRPF